MLKKLFLFFLLFLLVALPSLFSQVRNYLQQPSLGVHLVLNSFTYKDSGQTFHNQGRSRFGLAIDYLQGITPHLDLDATVSGSFLDYPGKSQGSENKHLLTEADLSLREKLFPASTRWNPFLKTGLGFSYFLSSFGLFIPAGLGLQVNLPGETFLLFHSQYRIPLTTSQSGHLYFSMGIAGIIGKKKRTKAVQQPTIAVVARPVSFSRDSDGDGIPDDLDLCPTVAGFSTFSGCPDTDRDGIPDQEDQCPTVAGSSLYQGCPPPNSHSDPIDDNLRSRMDKAAQLVFFATDSAILLPASFKALDEVIDILQQDSLLRLDISGHTDNSGSSERNRQLSERRAGAVLDYLRSVGHIDSRRLSSAGYGSSRPIADNATLTGKARNRRVQFVLHR